MSGEVDPGVQDVLSRVLLMRPHTPEELRHTLTALESTVHAHNVVLVVVDSIAAIARLEYQGTKVGCARRAPCNS